MTIPDYKRAFDQPDFRGYFTWTQKLTQSLGGSLYHACHEDELIEIVDNEELGLRSKWTLNLPKHGQWSAPGVWVGLNYFSNGNYYGPLLIEFPLSVLNGRHFMVFRRESDRQRTFFVQYEARIPIYSFGKTLWRSVDPTFYFKKANKEVSMKPGAIYDIILTEPLALADFEVRAVDHPKCISGKCGGTGRATNESALKRVARREADYVVNQNPEVKKLLKHFPCLDRTLVRISEADE